MILADTLEQGTSSGDFAVEDPQLPANALFASGLGALHLARVGILVDEAAPGVPTLGSITPRQVRCYLVAPALALTMSTGNGAGGPGDGADYGVGRGRHGRDPLIEGKRRRR